MIVSLASIVINFAVAYAMVHTGTLGHAGLALATSSVAWFGFVCLFWVLRSRIGGIQGRALMKSILQIVAASAGMGLVVILASRGIQSVAGVSRIARLADLAVSIPLGAFVFYFLCRSLKVAEFDTAVRALSAPLAALISRRRGKI